MELGAITSDLHHRWGGMKRDSNPHPPPSRSIFFLPRVSLSSLSKKHCSLFFTCTCYVHCLNQENLRAGDSTQLPLSEVVWLLNTNSNISKCVPPPHHLSSDHNPRTMLLLRAWIRLVDVVCVYELAPVQMILQMCLADRAC